MSAVNPTVPPTNGPPVSAEIRGNFVTIKAELEALETGKQDTLVSGTNIKTINGSSVLGSGNLVVSGSAAWGSITGTLSAQTDLQDALDAKLDDSQATAFGLSLLNDATAADGRATLGLGTAATANTGDFAASSHTHTAVQITDFNSASRAQTEAELIAGTNITITPAGSGATRTLTIAATGGGGGITAAEFYTRQTHYFYGDHL